MMIYPLESAGSLLSRTTSSPDRWTTPAGLGVTRTRQDTLGARAKYVELVDALDHRRGLLVHRGADRAVGYVDPPVEITARGRELRATALNARGRVLLPAVAALFCAALGPAARVEADGGSVWHEPGPAGAGFAEEERTRQVGLFRALRSLVEGLAVPGDPHLGLFGAFGYDLVFRMEPMPLSRPRPSRHRDMVLHIPDQIYELDLSSGVVTCHAYEFCFGSQSTDGLERATPAVSFVAATHAPARDHRPGEYAEIVQAAKPLFRSGDMFEVVPSQSFHCVPTHSPARLYHALRAGNPTSHNLLMSLGAGEYLIGSSPEMFVRVTPTSGPGRQGALIETSPISGTIARGRDAIGDADQIRALLNSAKDEHELTMCTDVDRNDKSRICLPGSVRVTARRRIELYSTLIHTVDRVEGTLRPDRDALDAFLAHLWAVTVTGAPKPAAIEFIERRERSPRRWYGGAVGRIGFDGGLDTVLTLRTIHIHEGVATVRAGATVLHDSDPVAEERETELKAKALLTVLSRPADPPIVLRAPARVTRQPGEGRRILLVDHRDSFVHCLGGYLRETGAEVATYRHDVALEQLDELRPDLLVLSPGPGRPADFAVSTILAEAERLGVAVFGVCLGLQGIVEYLGGELELLPDPVHGKPSRVRRTSQDSILLDGLPDTFTVGRYHSLYARAAKLPDCLPAAAVTEDGSVAMAVEDASRRFAAVQFHPESIMTHAGDIGRRVVHNAVERLATRARLGVVR